jgi:DNA-binding NarL/FixJ family response regulator
MRVALAPDLEICGEAADVAEATRLAAELKPDIIITDISLKTGDGIELIKRVRARDEKVRILVWSMHNESIYADRALRCGAMGYITKEQATEKIVDALRQIMAGNRYLSPEFRERLLARVAERGQRQKGEPVDSLTDRELQVFCLIGEGVKTQVIADRLHLSIKTVETHRDRIKKKLNLKDATDLVRSAALWVAAKA